MSASSARVALVVSDSDAERERGCRWLVGHGWDPVGFADCSSACAWLEEETPAVALVVMPRDERCGVLMETLGARGVALASLP